LAPRNGLEIILGIRGMVDVNIKMPKIRYKISYWRKAIYESIYQISRLTLALDNTKINKNR